MTYPSIGLKELWKRLSRSRIVANLNELHTHRVGVVMVALDAGSSVHEHLGEFELRWIVCCSLIRRSQKGNF
jgi:hypothetical protein